MTIPIVQHRGILNDEPCFCVDAMLGNIARRLRILGFDTIYPCSEPLPECWFVTARLRSDFPGTIRIIDRELKKALKVILEEAEMRPQAHNILSRCVICNQKVEPALPEEVISLVPEAIGRCYSKFTKCEKCGRIYWKGSHYSRIFRELKDWRIL